MRGERGFTFVEVLLVMVLLSVGVLGYLQTTLLAARLDGRSRALAAAAFLAQERVERIGALGWERATAGLERGAEPGLLDGVGEVPRERVERNGVRFLLLHEREAPPGVLPRCVVRCFWAEAGRAFERGNHVRLEVRKR